MSSVPRKGDGHGRTSAQTHLEHRNQTPETADGVIPFTSDAQRRGAHKDRKSLRVRGERGQEGLAGGGGGGGMF